MHPHQQHSESKLAVGDFTSAAAGHGGQAAGSIAPGCQWRGAPRQQRDCNIFSNYVTSPRRKIQKLAICAAKSIGGFTR